MRALIFLAAALMTLPITPARAAAGVWDKGFGKAGFARIGFDAMTAVGVQRDGKVLSAGWISKSNANFAVTRTTGTGAVDKSFASGKTVTIDFGAMDRPFGIGEAPGGKVVVAGNTIVPGESLRFAIARLTSSGKLDKTFGEGGKVTSEAFGPLDSGTYAGALAVQPDGKILVAGNSGALFFDSSFTVVLRYNLDGTLDPTFGTGGVATTFFSGAYVNRMRVASDGSIVVVGGVIGSDDNDMFVARFLGSGELDPQFGDGGSLFIDVLGDEDWATGLAILSDDKIVMSGLSVDSHDVSNAAVIKLRGDGTFDTSFSKDGKAFAKIGPSGSAFDLVVGSDGKPVVAHTFCIGGARKCYFVALTRFTKTGSPDRTFGAGGTARPWGRALGAFPTGRGASEAGTALQKGKLLVGGTLFSTMGIARLSL